MAIRNTSIVEELSLPPVKVHCSVLAEDAIKAAIRDYQQKQQTPQDAQAAAPQGLDQGQAEEDQGADQARETDPDAPGRIEADAVVKRDGLRESLASLEAAIARDDERLEANRRATEDLAARRAASEREGRDFSAEESRAAKEPC